jgi:flagellar hook-basal body complex protein FliE
MPIPLTPFRAIEPIAPFALSGAQAAAQVGPTNFKELLKGALGDLSASQVASHQAIKSLATGGEENLHEVIIAMEKAGMTFRYAMQIRNKVLEAYQSVIQMQV